MMEEVNNLIELASRCIDGSDYSKAIMIYNSLLKEFSEEPKFWALRGYCKYHKHTYAAALKDFNQALMIYPNASSTLFYRARTYEYLDCLDEALADYYKCIELSPAADVYFNIGMIYEYRKDYKNAKISYLAGMKHTPDEYYSRLIKMALKRIRIRHKYIFQKEKFMEYSL